MRVALGQVDATVGDVRGNEARVAATIEAARAAGADLVVFPELVLPGYPPKDLLLEEDFVREVCRATARLARVAPELAVVLGTLQRAEGAGKPLYNSAALLRGGGVEGAVHKSLLPAGEVFDEPRWFRPGGAAPDPFVVAGRRVGLLVCEDLWDEGYPRAPVRERRQAGAELLVCINASPFRRGVLAERLRRARRAGADLVYVNAVGAQDDLIFDGSSFALTRDGQVLAALPPCEEAVRVVDLAAPASEALQEASLRQALVLGVRDFARKNGLGRAVVGLSGGVDSALVLCLAARALGPERVQAVHIPSRYTSARSTRDSRQLCEALGVDLAVVDLEPLHAAAEATLAGLPDGGCSGGVAENAQARLRGVVLMAYVNRLGGVLLNTSNKTELALGYGTLYGDLAGGLGVIADLNKSEVFALARQEREIPASILERAPSAELAPDQVDPFDYERLSPLVDLAVAGASRAALRNAGAEPDEIEWLRRRLRAAEFKRQQAPPGLKVSWSAFGSGRRRSVTEAPSGLARQGNAVAV